MKKILIAAAASCFIVLLALYIQEKSIAKPILSSEQEKPVVISDYKNIEYLVDGDKTLLVDGISQTVIPGSSAKVTTGYFGNELRKDLNDDGREDVVFLITRETGGSGTFFYIVAALDTEAGFVGSEALYLGDRISPQNINSGTGKTVIVNYADRLPSDSFAVPTSIGKSLYLLLDLESMQFGEVVQDFEGEADPSVMTLDMNTWQWIRTDFTDGSTLIPKVENKFSLKFTKDGRFSATTDCNSIGGSYVVDAKNISFGEMMMTLMYCEGSQEAEFSKLLTDSTSYHFTGKGELILELKFDSGTVTFR